MRKAWDSSTRLGWGRRNKALAGKFGENLPKRLFLDMGKIFGDAEDVFVHVDGSSHASSFAPAEGDVKMM